MLVQEGFQGKLGNEYDHKAVDEESSWKVMAMKVE
jgi:hypothetical protein